MGEAVQALSALFVELEDITKLLNDYEKTRNNKALSQAAVKIKTGAPKLKEILANPSYKNADTAPLMQQLKNGFRDAFARAKALKDGRKASEDKDDEEAPLPSSPSKRAVTNGSPSSRSTDRERDKERGDRGERERERRERKGDATERDGADEDDEDKKRKEQEAAREKERERRKREEEKEKERQRRDAKKKADEEEEERKTFEQDRVKEEEKRRAEIARKAFEEEEAKDKEFRRQAYLKKKEEDVKRADQAKRIMEGEDADEIETTDLRAKFKGKDIWSSILKDQEVKSQAEYGEGNFGDSDFTLIFVGSKNSGKSTLISRFLEKFGEPKPSTALEYNYGRHAKVGTGVAKDAQEIVHTWELAGGTSLMSMFDVSLTAETIQHAVVVIVIDLSEPSTIMDTLLKWQESVRNRADECINQIIENNPLLVEALKKNASLSFPESHPDRETVKPIPIPTIIVGTKYDLFQDFEAERRKVCVRTLRYFANTTGSSLVFVTAKDARDDGSFTKLRALLNYYLFKTPHNRTPVTEYTKPIFIPAGMDTFESIGRAPYGPSKTGTAAWKSSFDQVFPPLEEKAQDMGRFEDDFTKFPEASIDSLRLEKEKELDRIRRLRGREQTNGIDVIPPSEPTPSSNPRTRKKRKHQ